MQRAFDKKWNYEKIYKYGQSRTWKTVAKEVYQVFQNVLIKNNPSCSTKTGKYKL